MADKRLCEEPYDDSMPEMDHSSVDISARFSDANSQSCESDDDLDESTVRYYASPDFVLREIAGEGILVPVGASSHRLNGMITFTESGVFLWKQLMDSPKTRQDLSRALAAEYDITSEAVDQDVEAFIRKAIANDMVRSA